MQIGGAIIVKKKIVPIFAASILILIVAGIGVVSSLIKKYTPSDERVDVEFYFGIEENDDLAMVMQNEVIEDKGKIIDGVAYIHHTTIKEYLNDRFYWDAKENVMVYTTPMDVITVDVGSKDYYVSKNKITENYTILKVDGSEAYLAAEFVQKYTNMEYSVFTEPNRIRIMYKWDEIQTVQVKKDDSIRESESIKSRIITEVKKGDVLTVLSTVEGWKEVITEDGYVGYIEAKKLTGEKTEVVSRAFEEPVYTSISKDYIINLTWHQVTHPEANNEVLSMIADTKGLTTLSPTWFSIADNDGNISSLASSTYVNYAHQNNIEVWGLVDNFNPEISTLEVLSSTSKRENLINQLISVAINYKLDGINIDFEDLEVAAGEPFIQFLRELSIKCRNNNIVLSVDNPVPMPYTQHYNRKEQGIVADYVIIMGYDEHYAGSEESGSVASLPFVIAGIENTLDEVPKEKVINGVPFYARLWKEEIAEDGSITVTSEALGMNYAESILALHGVEKFWSEETSQYYAEFQLEDGLYKIWLEDEASMEEKAKLIKTYNLAGIASWKLGLEKDSIWDIILKYVN
jgi:Predicted glycosyl hydrolase